jgi:protein TonB
MTEFRLQRDEIAGPLATPGYQVHVTSPAFKRARAAIIAVVLHAIPVVAVVAFLRWPRPAAPAEQPTLELVMDKSAYVGTGPQVLSPTPAPVPRPVPPPVPAAAKAPPLPAPPPPVPPQISSPPQPVLAAVKPVAELPTPTPPPPAAPPVPKPVPHPAPAKAKPAPPASVRVLGDNQPVGHGEAYGRIIPARPDATINPKPAYPLVAREHGEQGRVLLSIHIAPSGRPSEVDIVSSSGFAVLDKSAQSAVQGWQFQPALVNGKPVGSVLLFPIEFQLEE